MASYNIVRSGAISVTSADVGTTKTAAIAAVKTASSIVVATIRDRRKNVFVQRGQILVAPSETSPKDATLGTAVDVDATQVTATVRENRDGQPRGATVYLLNTTTVRCEFYGTVDATENIDARFEAVEHKPRRGATIRLVNTTTVELGWDVQLVAGETIDAQFFVLDLDDLGDDFLEVLFRLQRENAWLGENLLQDLIAMDDAGNPVTYRVRIFDTKANCDAATRDLDEAAVLQAGELARYKCTQDISISKNDRKSITMVRTHLLPTPGVS